VQRNVSATSNALADRHDQFTSTEKRFVSRFA
jgi:hypothetical protein